MAHQSKLKCQITNVAAERLKMLMAIVMVHMKVKLFLYFENGLRIHGQNN